MRLGWMSPHFNRRYRCYAVGSQYFIWRYVYTHKRPRWTTTIAGLVVRHQSPHSANEPSSRDHPTTVTRNTEFMLFCLIQHVRWNVQFSLGKKSDIVIPLLRNVTRLKKTTHMYQEISSIPAAIFHVILFFPAALSGMYYGRITEKPRELATEIRPCNCVLDVSSWNWGRLQSAITY